MPEWISDLIELAPWLAVTALAIWLVVKVFPFVRKVIHFIDDVAGEPERPGTPARPGLMERVERIEHEVTTNHGSSLKDAVKVVEAKQAEHEQLITDIHERLTGD